MGDSKPFCAQVCVNPPSECALIAHSPLGGDRRVGACRSYDSIYRRVHEVIARFPVPGAIPWSQVYGRFEGRKEIRERPFTKTPVTRLRLIKDVMIHEMQPATSGREFQFVKEAI